MSNDSGSVERSVTCRPGLVLGYRPGRSLDQAVGKALALLVVLKAVNRYRARGLDSQADLTSLGRYHGDADVVADNDGFVDAAGQDQHDNSSVKVRGSLRRITILAAAMPRLTGSRMRPPVPPRASQAPQLHRGPAKVGRRGAFRR